MGARLAPRRVAGSVWSSFLAFVPALADAPARCRVARFTAGCGATATGFAAAEEAAAAFDDALPFFADLVFARSALAMALSSHDVL